MTLHEQFVSWVKSVMDAPAWVKQICGIGLTPAERMGGGGR